MTQMSTVKARDQFSTILNRAAFGKERVVLTRRGKQLAALVPMEDVQALEALEEQQDLQDARAALAEARRKGTIPWKTIKNKRAHG